MIEKRLQRIEKREGRIVDGEGIEEGVDRKEGIGYRKDDREKINERGYQRKEMRQRIGD